jgi:hypothetical protein
VASGSPAAPATGWARGGRRPGRRHAYAELDDTAAALVQLRYYVHHADSRDERLLDTRFVTAQLLAAEGLLGEALAELQVLRPAFEERYGPGSVHVRNLERQADRLRHPDVS